ncbi:Pml1p [Sugiyamaella lignohabitans]|uniref:Pml1p n=1 Tax=Sugiyamaella lignohabitans TaxID=796027 RepID=A0A161HL10_9ASCO|nr:Pml1p [Sugiyamaella lignohabitans]ANB13877.1 Pml1p [Sugiyamaella lignohabitans]
MSDGNEGRDRYGRVKREYRDEDWHERQRRGPRNQNRSRSPGRRPGSGARTGANAVPVKREDRGDGGRTRSHERNRDRDRDRDMRREWDRGSRDRSGIRPKEEDLWSNDDSKEAPPSPPPVKPNYSHSGVLTEESKKDSEGNILKYHEPEDATTPPKTPEYRIYVFSESEQGKLIDTIKLNQKSHYLLGRDTKVCDIPVDIKSCSRQHAVIQFRRISKTDRFGDTHHTIKPYIIDLESSYGTQLNGDDVPPSRYVELRNKDLIQFCGHPREYLWIES